MKTGLLVRLFVPLAFIILAGCEAYPPPPPVTPQMTAAMPKKKRVSMQTLQDGRNLFARRCIECHTAPNLAYYSSSEWPRIIDSMAHRSNLSEEQRQAIVAYILAARGQ